MFVEDVMHGCFKHDLLRRIVGFVDALLDKIFRLSLVCDYAKLVAGLWNRVKPRYPNWLRNVPCFEFLAGAVSNRADFSVRSACDKVLANLQYSTI